MSSRSQPGRSSANARRRPVVPSDPGLHAHKIAEAVEAAWHGTYGTGRLDVPLSVVATLAALPQKDSNGGDVAALVAHWDPEEFHEYTRHTWSSVIRHRPETTHLLHPMISWIFEEPDAGTRSHASVVADAALRAGQLDLTGTERRSEVDLLGTVLTLLRPKSALQARGQFYTPASVATLLARMSGVEEHGDVTDPMMGTGGMFRAVAETMREQGRDPRTTRWSGCDIDAMAVACATVNSMIWGLGTDIVFRVGNTLEPRWREEALAQRDELVRLAADLRRDVAIIEILKSL